MIQVVGTVLSATVLAAVVGALTTVWMARKKSLEEDRARVRGTYADAFEAVAAYKELPYAIRRRQTNDAAAERHRLSEEARQIQQKLSYYRAWIQGESETVGTAYDDLVRHLRVTAGRACHDAWNDQPVQRDADMNISLDRVNLTSLGTYEAAYISAVQTDLKRRNLWRAALPRGRQTPARQQPPEPQPPA